MPTPIAADVILRLAPRTLQGLCSCHVGVLKPGIPLLPEKMPELERLSIAISSTQHTPAVVLPGAMTKAGICGCGIAGKAQWGVAHGIR